MKKLILFPLAALAIAGCTDARKEQPIEPNVEARSSETGVSTVCLAYQSELAAAQSAGDAERIAALEAVIAEACDS